MKLLQQYILEVLGFDIQYRLFQKKELGKLPYFIGETYLLYNASLLNLSFILVEKSDPAEFSIMQTKIHFKLIRQALNKKTVLFAREMTSLNRRRLIEKGINFIVPGKQLYLPDFLIDLREDFSVNKVAIKKEALLPSAQVIVLYRILHRNKAHKIEDLSFKELAGRLGYTPMAITFASENLKQNEVCEIVCEREKYIRFNLDIPEMWHDLEKHKLLANPVMKRVYTDKIDGEPKLLLSGDSALPKYSNMNPSRQVYKAIEKKVFYLLKKQNALLNLNDKEGNLCLEVWKYDPLVLAKDLNFDWPVVDPLSLYLSLRENPDERTKIALQQIIEKNIW